MSEMKIKAKDGGSFSAYVAKPKQTPAPAVILIQEIFGVNKEMQDKCDALAEQGYLAVCPDLFWRIEPGIQLVDSIDEQLQRAFQLFGEFNVEQGMNDLQSTLGQVRKDSACNGVVGNMGYCLGGKLAYMMATQTDTDASVSYYGVAIDTMLDQAKNIKKPLLMHIAEEDQFVNKEAQTKIKAALSKYPNVTIYSYPGMEHAFARGQGMHYNEEAATLANKRTSQFLQSTLKQAMAA